MSSRNFLYFKINLHKLLHTGSPVLGGNRNGHNLVRDLLVHCLVVIVVILNTTFFKAQDINVSTSSHLYPTRTTPALLYTPTF